MLPPAKCGIGALEAAILETVQAGKVQAADLDLAINQRQAAALLKAKTSLEQVQATITQEFPLDFWTIDLRGAVHALGEITGEELMGFDYYKFNLKSSLTFLNLSSSPQILFTHKVKES